MAFKFIVLAAFVAIASAEGPAAYDINTLSIDHNGIGYSQESTQKGYGGQNVVSAYSRSEDSAYSTVRVSNSHVGNDALLGQPAYGYGYGYNYAAPALAKPLIAQPVIAKAAYAAHSAPLFAKAAYAAPAPILKTTYAAPAYGYAAPAYGYAAPAYGYASPLLAKTYAAPAYGYASPLLAKTYAAPAPVIAKAAYTYAATPLIAKTAYAAPLAARTYAAPIAAAPIASAPLLAKTAIAAPPALAYTAHAAPLIAKTYAAPYSYETAAPVVHAAFSGFGTSYSW